ncbi:hypothetical protein J2P12_03955, partial [Candidatus Bathyarchaeota archaeon]|nr:hypothetical protein [Candidatus Bathyarchaeota archaeon]
GAALLIYKVNDSIATGHGNLRLVDAHPGGDLNDAGFGPCSSPCISNNTFSDAANFVKIIITNTTSTAYTIVVDRTNSPMLLLQVNTPAPGITVTVDGTSSSSDRSNQLRLPVHYGPHEIFVQQKVPVTIGASSIQVGLTVSFASWDDGNTANPRWVSVTDDTVITATYRVIVESSFATAATATLILAVVFAGIFINQWRRQKPTSPFVKRTLTSRENATGNPKALLPGDNGLGHEPVDRDKESDNSKS